MIRYTFLFFLLSISFDGTSQSLSDNSLYVPPSPNAANLNRYVSTPVNLYTGTPQIDLPIAEVKGRNLSVPISLSYHASGIKVQDVASWVGLGWSLQAGGVISRVVRGLPDEKANGYCGTNNIGEKAYEPINKDYVWWVSSRQWDGEPDLFYFNFLGKTGMFILDEKGQAVTLPYSNFKIQPAICPFGLGKWIFTDVNGVKYTFGADASSKESTTSKVSGLPTSETYISAWYLSEIKSPEGETITFSYTVGEPYTYKYYTQNASTVIKSWGTHGSGCIGSPSTTSTRNSNIEITISQPVYLSSISSVREKIMFSTAIGRNDLPGGRRLDNIQLADINNNPINRYSLDYSYFLSDNCDADSCRRLKLNQVLQTNSGINNKMFSFEYNPTNLPPRSSHQVDHWGYHNSNAYSSKIPAVDDSGNECGISHPGADRSADSLRSRANILTKVHLPTGGYKQFSYEANKYLSSNGELLIAGGVRILSIKDCADQINCVSQNYYYTKFDNPTLSSGLLNEIPIYHNKVVHNYIGFMGTGMFGYGNITLYRQSHSLTNLFDLNGHHVGYSSVRMGASGSGYVWSLFTNLAGNEDIIPIQYGYNLVNGQNGSISGEMGAMMNSNTYPFTPKTSRAWERGILLNETTYSQTGKILLSKQYKYKFDLALVKSIPASKIAWMGSDYFKTYYAVGNYNSNSRPYILENTHVTRFSDISDSGVKTITEYTTNTNTLLNTKAITYNDQHPNSKVIQTTKYITDADYSMSAACDQQYNQCLNNCSGITCMDGCDAQYYNCLNGTTAFPEVKAIIELQNRYQWSSPIEIQSWTQEGSVLKLVSAEVYKYGIVGSTANPFVKAKEVWSIKQPLDQSSFISSTINSNGGLTIDPKMRLTHNFESYDVINGNLLQQTSLNGIKTSYQWGFNSSLVIASTVNPGSSTSMTKSYNYIPSVGLIQSTDPNGRSTNYQYDRLNRLKIVKDHDNNILTRYRYHYVGQNESLNAPISVGGCQLQGNQVYFYSSDNPEFGETTYIWNFGDGTPTSTGSFVTHTYANPGTYTVLAKKSNPEQYGVDANIQVVIQPGLTSVSICADGPVTLDKCGINSPSFGNCTESNTSNYSPTVFTAVANGPANYFSWEYSDLNGQWISFGNGTSSTQAPSVFGFYGLSGSYQVRCKVGDACSNQIVSNTIDLYLYSSASNCFGFQID
jgi:YD repeat-containing protein